VDEGSRSDTTAAGWLWRAPLPHSYINFFGRKLLRFLAIVHGLVAFALITLGVMFTKSRVALRVIRPLVLAQMARSGLSLLPMILFLALALGLLIIGQTVALLQRFGVTAYLGTIMVTVVVRELGPLLTAVIVLARAGTANVVELGTARALGEVEALEVLGIDPIHYFVMPRVIGMALSIFSLTVYLILVALASGYFWAFIQNVPLRPGDYFSQLAGSLRGLDFIILGLKTFSFGIVIATVTCYFGLATPLRLEEVSHATVRAVAQSVVVCVLVDALFIVVYLVA